MAPALSFWHRLAWPLSGQPGCCSCIFKGLSPASRCLLCNQKRRSCCLDISIFISFIYFILMSFREYFLCTKARPMVAYIFLLPLPLTRLGEGGGGVRTGVRGFCLILPLPALSLFFLPVPATSLRLSFSSLSWWGLSRMTHTLQIQAPGSGGPHPHPDLEFPAQPQ